MRRGTIVRGVLGTALCVGLLGAGPGVAAAATIEGTVTAEEGGAPIAGISACRLSGVGEEGCVLTDAAGHYAMTGLPAGTYYLSFSGDAGNLDFVTEQWNDKREERGDPIVVGASETRAGIDAALAEGATIAGRVTDAATGLPVAGFPVCAFATTPKGENGRCSRTDAEGNYSLNGLRELPNFQVEFSSRGELNYQDQWYDEQSDYFESNDVAAGAPGTVTSGIDAALKPGAEIRGTLYEVGTHLPLAGVRVSTLWLDGGREDPLEPFRTATTNAAGQYALRGLSAGEYVVGFSYERFESEADSYSTEWYMGSTELTGATHLHVVPPQILTGIDGEVRNLRPPGPPPLQVLLQPAPKPQPKPLPCRKGFEKKRVKGKQRCVKRHHRKHRHHRHGRGHRMHHGPGPSV